MQLPAFLLTSTEGDDVSFPSGGAALICFVKEDCPTCNTAMPVIDAWHRGYGGSVNVLVPGQTEAGNRTLIETHALAVPVLDDSTLKVSFAYEVEIVPTLILADGEGREVTRLEGFVKEDWQAVDAQLAELAGSAPADVDWSALPDWRPGCGSLSVDPLIADRLRAEAENSPLRARKIEIAAGDDEFEFMFDQGFTDGLPVVPPTPERVIRMLAGTRRDPQDVVAVVPPNMGEATVEKVAVNAVLAGCKPEYLPVIIAGLEAVCTDDFNIHGVMATTMGASPLMVVNGPIRHQLGMNMELGALGQGNRANASIGRALRLVIRNIGGARPGGTERSTMGNPMKFTMCFPEWEERNPWKPLHVERGFAPEDSVVTVFAMTSGPSLIVDQDSLTTAQLGGSIGMTLAAAHHPRARGFTDVVLVVCPEHIDTLVRDGATKESLLERIVETSSMPLRDMVADERSGVGLPAGKAAELPDETLDRPIQKFKSSDDIHIVVAGGDAGKFSAAFYGWVTGEMGSVSVSRKIEV
jgi:hypothetical protein